MSNQHISYTSHVIDQNLSNTTNGYNSPFAYSPHDNYIVSSVLDTQTIQTIHSKNLQNNLINNNSINNNSINNNSQTHSHGSGQIIVGAGTPTNTCGVNGDTYIDKLTGDVYQNRNRIWIFTSNIHCKSLDRNPNRLDNFTIRDNSMAFRDNSLAFRDNICSRDNTCSRDNVCMIERGLKGERGSKGVKGDTGLKGIKGLKGDNVVVEISYISTFTRNNPGTFTSVVPTRATMAYISAVGGGGGGSSGKNLIGFFGGGGAGAIIKYPITVSANQQITGTIGKGGNGAQQQTIPTNGTDTTITIGSLTIKALGGLAPTLNTGGYGGSVEFPAGMVVPTQAAGGTADLPNGNNGLMNVYSFGGGGGGFTGGTGGNVAGFTGGIGSSHCTGGGGGASAFANGGNGATGITQATSGTLGSGGGGAVHTGCNLVFGVAGNGGNGFIRIDYYTF
ncbi:collagen triple helix repeat containing protein [Cotonvirus japonicus]|uniref:Collagen triple helix repeat containing protein n=1 Tax=Cotonvirus japonicus TaxID=2811091 RepID=A0ABM7NS47_9VIRU|nr:collagen triple helix repeat containing protein [Cotonvirus japonicus]BCS82983.1 collagen triple helix repeat containing protein [Cotonvirus japonicus]